MTVPLCPVDVQVPLLVESFHHSFLFGVSLFMHLDCLFHVYFLSLAV